MVFFLFNSSAQGRDITFNLHSAIYPAGVSKHGVYILKGSIYSGLKHKGFKIWCDESNNGCILNGQNSFIKVKLESEEGRSYIDDNGALTILSSSHDDVCYFKVVIDGYQNIKPGKYNLGLNAAIITD
ncbi:TPA: AfaD family invasin [Providencia alcalifaciens]